MLESNIAQLYISFLEHIMRQKGTEGYNYWPKPAKGMKDAVSERVSKAFWKLVETTPLRLHPRCDGENLELLELSKALLVLSIDPFEGHAIPNLMLELGETNLVSPKCLAAIKGLRSLQKSNPVTPAVVLKRLRSRKASVVLEKLWKVDHGGAMDYMNDLLQYVVTKNAEWSNLVGCTILPLADGTLGKIEKRVDTASQRYLINLFVCLFFIVPRAKRGNSNRYLWADPTATAFTDELLSANPQIQVHPELSTPVSKKLVSLEELNISKFGVFDLRRVLANLPKMSPRERFDRAVQAWKTYKSLPAAEVEMARDMIAELPILAAAPLYKAPNECQYFTLQTWKSNSMPLILAQDLKVPAIRNVLECFIEILSVSQDTFPETVGNLHRSSEDITKAAGLRRLLLCFKLLAAQKNCSVEVYIRAHTPELDISVCNSTTAFGVGLPN